MKITLASTQQVVVQRRGDHSMPVRLWKGFTEDGTPVYAFIASVQPQTHDAVSLAVFDRDLGGPIEAEIENRIFDARFLL